GIVEVAATIDHAPPDSLVLAGFAPARALRISLLTATDASHRPLTIRAAVDSSSAASGGDVAGPRFTIVGPLRSPIRVHWRVDPNVREGDDHLGYTGVRAGYLGARFGLVTGRGLFLLPQPATDVRDVRVRFLLPDGWRAVTPWRSSGDAWRTDLAGRFAAEHLIAATLGWGAFREHRF